MNSTSSPSASVSAALKPSVAASSASCCASWQMPTVYFAFFPQDAKPATAANTVTSAVSTPKIRFIIVFSSLSIKYKKRPCILRYRDGSAVLPLCFTFPSQGTPHRAFITPRDVTVAPVVPLDLHRSARSSRKVFAKVPSPPRTTRRLSASVTPCLLISGHSLYFPSFFPVCRSFSLQKAGPRRFPRAGAPAVTRPGTPPGRNRHATVLPRSRSW